MNHDQTRIFPNANCNYLLFFLFNCTNRIVTKYLNFQIIYVCFLVFTSKFSFIYVMFSFLLVFFASRYNNNTIIVYSGQFNPFENLCKIFHEFSCENYKHCLANETLLNEKQASNNLVSKLNK